MLVLCAVFALLTVGFVIPCAIDIATTPSDQFDVPSKQTWLVIGTVLWVFGAAAWLIFGRRDVRMRAVCNEVSTGLMLAGQASLWSSPSRGSALSHLAGLHRHPQRAAAVPSDFVAPDDNPAFLLELARRIRDQREGT